MYAEPVFARETVTHLMKMRVYLLRMFYILFIGMVFFLVGFLSYGSNPQQGVEAIYRMIYWFMAMAAIFIGPVFTAAAISVEKQKNTLSLLFLTDLSPAEIVIGKFLSRFVYAALIVLSTAPVLIMGVGVGGVTYGDILFVTIIVVSLLYFTCSVSIFFSAILKRNILVMVLAYIAIAVLEGVPAALGRPLSWLSAPYTVDAIANQLLLDPEAALGQIWACVLYSLIGGTVFLLLAAALVKKAAEWDLFSALSGLIQKTDAVLKYVSFENFGMSEAALSAKYANPFAWKETNARMFLRGKYLVRILVLLVIVSFFVYWWFASSLVTGGTLHEDAIGPSAGFHKYFLAFESVLFLAIITALASSSIIAEKENQVLDVLLTTPMNPGTLVTGKYYGMLRNVLFFAALPFIHIFAFVLVGALNPLCMFTFPLFLYLLFILAISQGLYISLHAKSTLNAVVVGFIANSYLMVAAALWSFYAVFLSGESNGLPTVLVVLVLFVLPVSLAVSFYMLKKTRDKFMVVLREKEVDFDDLLAG
jgi:ABC-type transport system involved in multi-copper enzyme maturation permease subunit